MSEATIHIDGGARGNPGPAACAVVIARPGLPPVEEGKTIGHATNNVAEYTALLRALEMASELGVKTATIYSDSELLVKQMNGEYRVKHPDLLPLYEEAKHLTREFSRITIQHVRREQNKRADELCNIALDGEKPKTKSATPAKPKAMVTDAAVRGDAIACLDAALRSPSKPAAAMVWDQLWSILEEGGVLKKVKK